MSRSFLLYEMLPLYWEQQLKYSPKEERENRSLNNCNTLVSLFYMELQVNSVTHQISLAAGLGVLVYAGLANWDDWKEFFQYFRESKFVSVANHWWIYVRYFSSSLDLNGRQTLCSHFHNWIPNHVEDELQCHFLWWLIIINFLAFSSSLKILNHRSFPIDKIYEIYNFRIELLFLLLFSFLHW